MDGAEEKTLCGDNRTQGSSATYKHIGLCDREELWRFTLKVNKEDGQNCILESLFLRKSVRHTSSLMKLAEIEKVESEQIRSKKSRGFLDSKYILQKARKNSYQEYRPTIRAGCGQNFSRIIQSIEEDKTYFTVLM